MRAEVDERIGFESMLRPKIGSEIEMRGSGIHTVGNFELVIAHSGGRLWHDHHIAKAQSGNAKATIFGGQVLSWERSVGLFHSFVVFGG